MNEDGQIEAAFYRELGRKLELRRKNCGLTQQALAVEIGCHRNEIYRWEAGISPMPMWMLMRISDVLGCAHLFLMPSKDYTWGVYAKVWREGLPPKKDVKAERDPPLGYAEETKLRAAPMKRRVG